jgi:ABC-2 type transport system permease protein
MSRSHLSWQLVRTAAKIGVADFRSTYTWHSWLFGWFARLMTQAFFFASFGYWLGSHSSVDYMAIGNMTTLVCMEALVVIPTINGERYQGTLALNVTAPGSFAASYLARNSYCPLIGTVSSTAALFAISAALAVPLAWPVAAFLPLLLALIGFSVYAFGFVVASVVMAAPSLATIALNFSYLSMMTFCGVNVPVAFWPAPVRMIVQSLPLTSGLRAVRDLLGGAPAGVVCGDCALTLAAGLGWLTLGTAVFAYFEHAGRRTGKLEFSA